MEVQIDVMNIVLQTDRLTLRAWKKSDLNDFFEYASVDGVGEMAGWKHHESIKESKQVLNRFIEGRNVFALVDKASGKVIGSLGIHKSWAEGEPEYEGWKIKDIGYVLSKEYWGKGLMPEAVMKVIKLCFEQFGLDALTIGHISTNHRSRRVIEKCGFYFVKESVFYAKHLEQSFDDMKYMLKRGEVQGV